MLNVVFRKSNEQDDSFLNRHLYDFSFTARLTSNSISIVSAKNKRAAVAVTV